jgi:hypothetical protein
VVGLVVLAVLDVVLVVAALDHVRPSAGSTANGDDPARGASRTGSAVPSSPTASASGPSRPGAVPEGPLLLAMAPDGALLRATLGGCTDDSDPQVAVSTDGGAKFRSLPVAPGLDGVMALDARGADDLALVGADADCTARLYSGGVDRRRWSVGSSEDEWFLVAGAADAVHAPGGPVETPCTPASLSTVGSVRLLCEDGPILGTADAGESWTTLGRLSDATAFAFEGPSRGFALTVRRNCPVAVVTTTDGGASWEFADCLDGETGRAIAARGDNVTALVDDAVFASEDGGGTWSKVG